MTINFVLISFFPFFSQYNDLMKKKRIVLNDKDKIASVIKELDEKKNEALRNAWKKVNKVRRDFNSLNSGQYILSCITDNKNATRFKT